MRTTIRMHDDLLIEVKAAAASSGQTLTAFIEDALRRRLDARRCAGPGNVPALPVFLGDGLLPGVDLDDAAALADLMESDHTAGT
ncbi:antitoxin VapB43 [bacterium BMS3Bbin02]|nr:antitoxin VapB43 [bacterium BMS3Bbin02]